MKFFSLEMSEMSAGLDYAIKLAQQAARQDASGNKKAAAYSRQLAQEHIDSLNIKPLDF